jgi:phospholipase/carboxylesterase
MILLHGRGASADGILSLAEAFADPEVAYFAPQAAGHSWYPHSFLAPLAHNEPWLSSALQVIVGMVRDLERDGIPSSRIVLLGFSQGGCLALEPQTPARVVSRRHNIHRETDISTPSGESFGDKAT